MYSIDMSPLKLCTELQIMFFECIIWSWGNTFLCRGQDRDSVRRAKVKSYTVYPVWLESINHKKNLAYLAKKKNPKNRNFESFAEFWENFKWISPF